ncbi:MAG: serine/threonine protein kinase, partial [Muribaculaceae bacterium]|nr:serine/threonine protein kinase [Muribaculaceae bacterium]
MNDNNAPNFLAPGTVLTGNYTYTIERVLGAGGFGITYLAVTQVPWGNVTIDCRVALKEHFFSDFSERAADGLTVTTVGTAKIRATVEGSLSDFVAEAQRLQKLGDGHPNIVKVNEVFRANDTAYYAMEYLEGISLAKATAGNPVSEESMLAVMEPIIDAVAFLHRERMLHLDIKPENIVLADGGRRPVLIDFGQSKHFLGDGTATATVNVKGVSHGFAPAEQYDGIRTFAPTADVYALGATMMACLTGTVPPKAIEWQTAQKARAIDTLPVSPALKDVLARALADDPAARFPDASALANALASNATRPLGGEISLQAKRSAITNLPTSGMVSSNATRPVERQFLSEESASRLSTAGSTRFSTVGQSTRLSIILIALAALAIGAGVYFAFRGGNNPQPPVSLRDTLAIAQTLETEPVEIETPAPEPQPTPQVTPAPTPQPTPVPQPAPQHQQE